METELAQKRIDALYNELSSIIDNNGIWEGSMYTRDRTIFEILKGYSNKELIELYKMSQVKCDTKAFREITKGVFCDDLNKMISRAKLVGDENGLGYKDILIRGLVTDRINRRISSAVNALNATIISEHVSLPQPEDIALQLSYGVTTSKRFENARNDLEELCPILNNTDKQYLKEKLANATKEMDRNLRDENSRESCELGVLRNVVRIAIGGVFREVDKLLAPKVSKPETFGA